MSENDDSETHIDKTSTARKTYQIGDVGSNARVQQGEKLTWVEALNGAQDFEVLTQQFRTLLEKISKAPDLDEDTRFISTKKTEAVIQSLGNAQQSPNELKYALIDAKDWFGNKASWIGKEIGKILSSDAAQKTIGTITENGVKGVIKAFIGETNA